MVQPSVAIRTPLLDHEGPSHNAMGDFQEKGHQRPPILWITVQIYPLWSGWGKEASGEKRHGSKCRVSQLTRLWRIFRERSTSIPEEGAHRGFQKPCGPKIGVDTRDPWICKPEWQVWVWGQSKGWMRASWQLPRQALVCSVVGPAEFQDNEEIGVWLPCV